MLGIDWVGVKFFAKFMWTGIKWLLILAGIEYMVGEKDVK